MKIDPQTVEKIAHLSRLQILPQEMDETCKNLEQTLNWMESLSQLDLADVEPLVYLNAEPQNLREDKVDNQLTPEEALISAPARSGDFFSVPKIIANQR